MDFGKILTRSWEVIWKHKVLWIFGILASCGSQGSAGGSFNYSFDSSSFDRPRNFDVPPGMRNFFFNLQHTIDNIEPEALFAISATIIVFALFVALVVFLLSIFGRMGLIKGVLLANTGHTLSFRQLIDDAAPFFGRGLGLNLILSLLVFLVGMAFAVVGIFFTLFTFGIGLICLIPLLCLLVPLGFAYGVYVELANIALVTEDVGIREALNRGWQVMIDNLGSIALMGIILVIGGGVVNFLFALPIGLVAVPALIGFFIGDGGQVWNGLAVSALCLVLAIPVLIVLGGILRSYIVSAWTLTYQELTAAPPTTTKRTTKSKS